MLTGGGEVGAGLGLSLALVEGRGRPRSGRASGKAADHCSSGTFVPYAKSL